MPSGSFGVRVRSAVIKCLRWPTISHTVSRTTRTMIRVKTKIALGGGLSVISGFESGGRESSAYLRPAINKEAEIDKAIEKHQPGGG